MHDLKTIVALNEKAAEGKVCKMAEKWAKMPIPVNLCVGNHSDDFAHYEIWTTLEYAEKLVNALDRYLRDGGLGTIESGNPVYGIDIVGNFPLEIIDNWLNRHTNEFNISYWESNI